MEQQKTDESIKTGLQIEGNDKPEKLPIAGAETGTEDTSDEKDADELVHQQNSDVEVSTSDDETDIDELVHKIPASKTVTDDNEVDPDDLVHQK